MPFFKRRKTVRVTFIDASDGNVIGRSDVPVVQLPQTFAKATTLHGIAGSDWEVLDATPATFDEYVTSGHLTVRLAKIAMIDPREVLFTLPTVSAEFPPAGEPAADDAPVLSVHEDDWRQTEFVSWSLRARVEQEFVDIRRVLIEDRIGGEMVGYRHCHARQRVPEPIAVDMTLPGVLGHFAHVDMLAGMENARDSVLIADTVAFVALGTAALYARVTNDHVVTLGLIGKGPATQAQALAPSLGRLMNNYELDLVDWGTATRIPAATDELAAFLTAS